MLQGGFAKPNDFNETGSYEPVQQVSIVSLPLAPLFKFSLYYIDYDQTIR